MAEPVVVHLERRTITAAVNDPPGEFSPWVTHIVLYHEWFAHYDDGSVHEVTRDKAKSIADAWEEAHRG